MALIGILEFGPEKGFGVHFIILCHPDTLAQEGHSPILAESFAEFLQKAQDSAGTYWWQSPTFQSYGDAISRMKRP